MASMYVMGGRTQIQFKGPDGKRRTIRLGRVDEVVALEIKRHVEHLADCWTHNVAPHKATTEWLAKLQADPGRVWLYDRIASGGLAPERERPEDQRKPARDRLRTFCDEFIAKRKDVKPTTASVYHQTAGNLCEYFGKDRRLGEITAGDAADFKRWLLTKAMQKAGGTRAGLAKATANRRTRCAKQFFEDAVDHELIDRNPFRKVKSGSSINRERLFFVSRSVTDRIIDACPDAEWRAIVALARYGGIRVPSELLPLRWEDVNFQHDKLTITSPKTAHCDKPFRVVPVEVFADIRPYLEDLLEVAKARGPVKATDHVITRYRQQNINLRTQLLRIMKRAGVQPWQKLFQNMRSSRETELIYLGHKIHEVCSWIGNSPQVANDHYLQVLESAAKAELDRDAAERAKKAMHGGDANTDAAGRNQGTASNCTNGQETQENPGNTAVFAGFSEFGERARQDSNL